jgi:hypothetical protein
MRQQEFLGGNGFSDLAENSRLINALMDFIFRFVTFLFLLLRRLSLRRKCAFFFLFGRIVHLPCHFERVDVTPFHPKTVATSGA